MGLYSQQSVITTVNTAVSTAKHIENRSFLDFYQKEIKVFIVYLKNV